MPSLSFSRWSSNPGAALDDEAGEPAGRLGEHEEDVAHRVRAEPLVAGQVVVVAVRARLRRAGADVRAALLLRHRHPAERAALVVGQRQPRLPLGGELGIDPQRGHGRVGHRDRAHHARVRLRPEQLERRAGDVRARARRAPRQRVDLALDRAAQQPVPARVVVDLVDPVPVAVVRAQPRRVALGAPAVLLRLGGAGDDRRSRARGRPPSPRPRAPAPRRARGRRRSRSTSSNGGGWLRTSCVAIMARLTVPCGRWTRCRLCSRPAGRRASTPTRPSCCSASSAGSASARCPTGSRTGG